MIFRGPLSLKCASSNCHGLDEMFSDRAERIVVLEAKLKSLMKDKKPDRVYGLRKDNSFGKVLSELYGEGDGSRNAEPLQCINSFVSPFGKKK